MEFSVGILLLFASLLGSFIQRVCGFGFGIFIMTILPYLMPSYPEATALSGFLSLIQSSIVLISVRKHLFWKHLIGILLVFCIFSVIAIKFVSQSEDHTLKILLGVILILLSLYFLLFSGKINIKPNTGWQFLLGGLSGTMGGLFGMHGPAAVIYFLSVEKTKEAYLAIAQAYFVLTNVYMSIFRANCGFVTSTVFISLLCCLPGIFIGIKIGKCVFDKIPQNTLKKIIYFYMIFAGLVSIFG